MRLKRSERKKGVTLIELLVAIVILSIFLLGLLPLLVGSVLVRRQQQLIAEATTLAQLELEETRRFWNLELSTSGTTTDAINFNNGNVPLFGEIDSNCNSRYIQLTSVGALNDPSTVAWNATNVKNYPIIAGLNSVTASTKGCNLKDASSTTGTTPSNSTKQVRFVAQLFYGVAPGNTRALSGNDCDMSTANQQTNCIRRVVVRIYKAVIPPNSTCNGDPSLSLVNFGTAATAGTNELAGKVTIADTENRNCVPTDPTTTQVNRLTVGSTSDISTASILNGRVPLVVLTTDIINP